MKQVSSKSGRPPSRHRLLLPNPAAQGSGGGQGELGARLDRGLPRLSHSQAPEGLNPEGPGPKGQSAHVLGMLLATRLLHQQDGSILWAPLTSQSPKLEAIQVGIRLGGPSLPGGRSCYIVCISGPWRCPAHPRCSMDTQ